MIRLTLRQFRTEAVIGFGLLAVLAILLAITGIHLAQVNDAFEVTCKAIGDCAASANPIFQDDPSLHTFLPLIVIVMPAVIGLFLGAPLIAGELETGTFRLAWTQSVTRRHWLAVKLGLVGLAAVAMSVLLTGMVDWWQSPFDAASQNRFNTLNFGFHGVAPIGYAAFAFALGVTAGVLLRRTVAAMGATLVGFVAARVAVTAWVRPESRRAAPRVPRVLGRAARHRRAGPGRHVLDHSPFGEHPERVGVLDRGGRHVRPHPHERGPATGLSRARPAPQRGTGSWTANSGPYMYRQAVCDVPHRRYVPARKPLLAVPVDRDGDVPRGRAGALRTHLLVAAPPVSVTSALNASNLAPSIPREAVSGRGGEGSDRGAPCRN